MPNTDGYDPNDLPDDKPDNPDPYADVPDPGTKGHDADVPPSTPPTAPRKPKTNRLISDEVVFGDLPPAAGGGIKTSPGIWTRRLQPLIENPGQWAQVAVYNDPGVADRTSSNLRAGKMRLPELPEGASFEFTSRANQPEEGQSAIWARFLPAPATPAPAAATTAAASSDNPVEGKNPETPELVPTTPSLGIDKKL